MALKLKRFEAAKYIEAPEDEIEVLSNAFKSKEPGYIAAAVGAVARARGMGEISAKAGINRTALYEALSEDGNPTLHTFLKVLDALDVDLHPTRAVHEDNEAPDSVPA